MATQVKFYSTTAASYSAIENKDAGGVYFVDGGELYKGTSRFGANKIYQLSSTYSISDVSGQIGGDLAIGDGWTKAWNGTAWVQIENANQIKMMVSMMTASLVSGNANSYITHITQDANGNVTAHAKPFPIISSDTKGDTSNGVTVSVTTDGGVVTNVDVTAPAYTATQSSVGDTDNGITVSVTTSKGQVTGVDVIATDLTPTTVSAQTGTFTNLTVTNNANFSVTNVSATTLTIGGSTVEQLADKQIAAIAATTSTGASNGITVSVTTSSGSVSKVEVNASAFGNVMRFRGVYSTPYSCPNPQGGDIIIIGGADTGYVDGQEWIYNDKSTETFKWELIGDQATYATKADLSFKASVGTSNATGGNGISGQLSLYSNAKPSLTITVSPVTTSAGITTTANTVVTASAVANYVTGKIGALAQRALQAFGEARHLVAWRRLPGNEVVGLLVGNPERLPFDDPVQLPFDDPTMLYWVGVCFVALVLLVAGVGTWLLVRAARRARQEALNKTNFVSLVSHELNTPLTAIIPYADMLRKGQITAERDRHEAYDVIADESVRLKALVAELLDFSRLERRTKKFAMTDFDVAELVQSVVRLMRGRFPDGAPTVSAEAPLRVHADADAVKAILVNLLDNAAKYAPGAPVEVAVEKGERGVRVEVRDRGPGLSPEGLRNVFTRFWRADDSTTASVGGFGLGLTIARSYAREMGGDLTCAARAGGGTVFTLELKEADHG